MSEDFTDYIEALPMLRLHHNTTTHSPRAESTETTGDVAAVSAKLQMCFAGSSSLVLLIWLKYFTELNRDFCISASGQWSVYSICM